jgi:hypothetical protein
MLPMKSILIIIQDEIFTGCAILAKIGAAFFIMFIAVEFIKGGIEATSGRGFTLDKILYLYLFLAILYTVYPHLQAILKDYAYDACIFIYDKFGGVTLPIKPSLSLFLKIFKSYVLNPIGLLLAPITVAVAMFVIVVSMLISLLAMIAIDVIVISAFLSFEIVVAAGLFFIPFFMSGELNHIGKQWLNNMLMCSIQLPVLAIVLKLVDALNSFAVDYFLKNVLGKHYIWDTYGILFIPLLGLGLIWQSLNLTKMLFPPSGGFVGTGIGTPVVGAVSYTLHTAASVGIRAITKSK